MSQGHDPPPPSILNGIQISIGVNSPTCHQQSPVLRMPTEVMHSRLDKENLKEALRQQLRRAIKDLEAGNIIEIDLSMQLSSAIEQSLREQSEEELYEQESSLAKCKKPTRDVLIGPFDPSPGRMHPHTQGSIQERTELAEAEAKFFRLAHEVSPQEQIHSSDDYPSLSEGHHGEKKGEKVEVESTSTVSSSLSAKKIVVPERDFLTKKGEAKQSETKKDRVDKNKTEDFKPWKFRNPPSTESQCEPFGETKTERSRRKQHIRDMKINKGVINRSASSDNTLLDIESISDCPSLDSNSNKKKEAQAIYQPLDELRASLNDKPSKDSMDKKINDQDSKNANVKQYFTKEYQVFQQLAETVDLDTTPPTSSAELTKSNSRAGSPKDLA